MTRKQLEKTSWAKELKIKCPSAFYDWAMELALDPDLQVFIVRDLCGIGWCIRVHKPAVHVNFFLAYRMPTRKSCIELCRAMNWKVRR